MKVTYLHNVSQVTRELNGDLFVARFAFSWSLGAVQRAPDVGTPPLHGMFYWTYREVEQVGNTNKLSLKYTLECLIFRFSVF